MASRSRGNAPPSDWDPMREEYENSFYDSQIPGEEISGGVQLDQRRLYITNIPTGLNDEGLQSAFSKYGTLTECFTSTDPKRRYGLVSFETSGEAKFAMTKLNRTEPLRLHISIAHKKDKHSGNNREQSRRPQQNYQNKLNNSRDRGQYERDYNDNSSISSRGHSATVTRSEMNGDEMYSNAKELGDIPLMDPDLELEMERLRVKEAEIVYQHRLRNLERVTQMKNQMSSVMGGRRIMADGRIVVRSDERVVDGNEKSTRDEHSIAGAGDSTPSISCSCNANRHKMPQRSDGSSTPSTCVLCSEECSKTEAYPRTTDKSSSDVTSRRTGKVSRQISDVNCELKYSDLIDVDNQTDETDRLIKLRNVDYAGVVDDSLKVVVALTGYPKFKMHVRHIEQFRVCLGQVMDMQLKSGLVKRSPAFYDYYLNRGALVFICKDDETRNWIVRISPGLQDRMKTSLMFFKTKVKRLCLAVLKIPKCSWPATAQDVFKLLQYFNPTLKTDMWKIYSQITENDVEVTSFIIDRVSGEIIRGPTFKNVIDYSQIDFQLKGYTEIYYENFGSNSEDLCSIGSRVKLLEEIRSAENSPRESQIDVAKNTSKDVNDNETCSAKNSEDPPLEKYVEESDIIEAKEDLENSLQKDVLKKLKDVQYIGDKNDVLVWSDSVSRDGEDKLIADDNAASTADVAVSDNTDSILGSSDNLICRNNSLNIDSNRGIAYHRRTNYLHVESELKIAITLEGYPQNKLEGTHIRRLKHLFKEYLHKDMKQQRFANLIIPKFQDIYLSNGAVIYVCDSLETKDYLVEVLPKFINSTGLKLVFRDIKQLVRYTRIVMRLPKELAHVETLEIIMKLQLAYPNLKPDCWKFYSDVAGKQKRQFGVDPVSLDVIKSPDFDPVYEGEKLVFRIIDRQKADQSLECSKNDNDKSKEVNERSVTIREMALKTMYVPIEAEITNAPLTRIRTNHYSDLIADDLKLYVGPADYPESRVDETLFHNVKREFENIVCDALDKENISEDSLPRFHDMYLFDGVIFIICVNFPSKYWIDQVLPVVNGNLRTNLKSTEFRGAVGIISMFVKTDKDTDEVIDILQRQNPRLRTKYWRKISTVRTKVKLDVILQIDKLSAQVITSPSFNKFIGTNAVQFKLGHLQSLLKPKASLEELTRMRAKRLEKRASRRKDLVKVTMQGPKISFDQLKVDLKKTYPFLKTESWCLLTAEQKCHNTIVDVEIDEQSVKYIEKQDYKLTLGDDTVYFYTDMNREGCKEFTNYESPRKENGTGLPVLNDQGFKANMKVPHSLWIQNKDDISVLFDMLEDKNPGLNTELWETEKELGKGCYSLILDKKSTTIVQGKNFDSFIAGERIKFTILN